LQPKEKRPGEREGENVVISLKVTCL